VPSSEKFSWEGGHGYCLSEKKKQNSNRVKGVEVQSIFAKVKNAKRVIFYPNCINGLKPKPDACCITVPIEKVWAPYYCTYILYFQCRVR
jgi:hypothetical protein